MKYKKHIKNKEIFNFYNENIIYNDKNYSLYVTFLKKYLRNLNNSIFN